MGSRFRSILAAYAAVFGILAGFMEAASAGVRDDLKGGRQYVISFLEDLGSIRKYEKFVVQYRFTHVDSTGADFGKTTASSVNRLNGIKEYANDGFKKHSRLSIWGALLLVDEAESCLKNSANKCVARIVGPLDPRGLNNDVNLIVNMVGSRLNYYKELNYYCDVAGKTHIEQPQERLRDLGDLLFFSSRALPLITDLDKYDEMQLNLRATATYLLDNHIEPYWTEYANCNSSPEILTNFQVSRGLYEYYKVTNDSRVPPKIKSWWLTIVSQGGSAWVDGVVQDTSKQITANFFGAYLHTAIIVERLGGTGLDSDITHNGLRRVLVAQVTSSSEARCLENGMSYLQFYGGWQHMEGKCDQKMSYHEFIVSSFVELQGYLNEKSYCSSAYPQWAFACSNLKWNVAAGISWVLNLQDPVTGKVWDRAKIHEGSAQSLIGTNIAAFLMARFYSRSPNMMPASWKRDLTAVPNYTPADLASGLDRAIRAELEPQSRYGTVAHFWAFPAYLRVQVDSVP